MYRDEKIDTMLSLISTNIDQLENELRDEYKKLIRVSSEFDQITAEFVLLQRMMFATFGRFAARQNFADICCVHG